MTHLKTLIATSVVIGIFPFASSAGAISLVNNGVYEAHVQSKVSGDFVQYGSWNAITGPNHSVGAGKNLLYKDTQTTTNFSSLRIFDPAGDRTYTFGGAGAGINLDPFLLSETPLVQFGSPSFQTVWDLTPENLGITQNVIVFNGNSTDESNSAIYHTVQITNNGNGTKSIGWRNLTDWTVNDPNFDDGPSNSIETRNNVIVGTSVNEFDYTPTGNEFVRISSSPTPPGGASYEPWFAIGFDPGFIPSLPVTRPTQYSYASWPDSVATAFDYTTTGKKIGIGDSTGLSWFGYDANSAISLAPGESVRLTQVIFAVDVKPVPEPGSLVGLLTIGALGVTSTLKRKQKQQ